MENVQIENPDNLLKHVYEATVTARLKNAENLHNGDDSF